ncbi:hypothetical protein GALL_537950 [mine drainage metagenome]|uniref:Uncharacterized protein n=1 Tax=mine drainage metagenome TaxID=410659 RepID=A0A1J5PM71_9ZZZZ
MRHADQHLQANRTGGQRVLRPHHPDQGLAQQHLLHQARRPRSEAADHEISAAAVQLIKDVEPKLGNHQAGVRRLPGHALHQPGDQHAASIGAGHQHESPLGRGRIKGRRRERRLKLGQCAIDLRPDLQGPWRRFQSARIAQEQLVVQGVSRSPQSVADRRLRQAQPRARPGRVALLHQDVEDPQQIQV